ncbi:MAG: ATP-binding cassette domain-containing protein, partial [Oscillospiraceae bacterium]|nr:ATP-binding cassette domain-containing protein [Oscillospiraceae bacterium]
MPRLEVRNLQKGFGGTEVLRGVSFALESGQVLAIIGSSGSGKTTLLRCLNFLETPDAGQILLDGEELLRTDENQLRKNRLRFGLVFQNFNLFPQYTALENVSLAPGLLKLGTREEIDRRSRELLSQVGLADKCGAYPYQLSGGQQQRTAIARALALRPEVLCFDEPTSALDPELTGEVLRVIRG